MRWRFEAEAWLWAARTDSWVFVRVPEEVSAEIHDFADSFPRRGFGGVAVLVRVGGSSWRTSVFPESGSGCYVLPLKRAVREAEGVEVGAPVDVDLELVL